MTNHTRDTLRTLAAVKSIVDERNIAHEHSAILVTLEHTVTAALLILMGNDPRKAAAMLNEGLLPGIENRLALYNARKVKGQAP